MIMEAIAREEIKPGDTIRIQLTLDDKVLWHKVADVVEVAGRYRASFTAGCREKVVTLRSPYYQVMTP